TAFVLWFLLSRLDGEAAGVNVLVLFVVTLPTMALGVAMTLSRTPWYPFYAARMRDPLADQQLAGVVMWAYGGLAAVLGGVALFAAWLRRLDQLSPGVVRPC